MDGGGGRGEEERRRKPLSHLTRDYRRRALLLRRFAPAFPKGGRRPKSICMALIEPLENSTAISEQEAGKVFQSKSSCCDIFFTSGAFTESAPSMFGLPPPPPSSLLLLLLLLPESSYGLVWYIVISLFLISSNHCLPINV